MPETTTADPAEVLAEHLAQAEQKTGGCGNCGDPLTAHGGEDGWVCRGPDGSGCEKGCTEWVDPRPDEPPATSDIPTENIGAKVTPPADPQPVDDAVDEPGTDLEPVERAQALPQVTAWQTIQGMAIELAQSNLVVKPLRGRPADVQLILLAAHDLGITATQALAKIHIIEGKPSMSAELMVALVLRDGHRIGMVEATSERAVAYGQRFRNGAPDGPECRMEFTIDEARTAGLLSKDVWKKYPKAMLWARAVSALCRMVFPDVLAGVTYVPEELGYVDAEGSEEAPTASQTTDSALEADNADFAAGEQGRMAVIAAIAALPEDRKAPLKEEWRQLAADRKIHPPTQLRASELDLAWSIVGRYTDAEDGAYTGPVEEAEIVTPDTAQDAAVDRDSDPKAAGPPPTGTAQTTAEPAEATDPAPKPFTCGGCGRVIQPPDAESKHEPGCSDAPF